MQTRADEEGCLGGRFDGDAGPCGQPGEGDEGFAGAGDLEDQGKAEGRTSFLREGVSAGARAGAGGGRRPWASFVRTWAAKEVAGRLE